NLLASRERFDQLIVRADQIAGDLQQGKGTAGKLLTDASIADELKTLVIQANSSMAELQVTLKNLQNASTHLPAISTALGNEAKELPGLVEQTQTSMRELERLIEGLQRHWLLRKYMNQTNPAPKASRSQ